MLSSLDSGWGDPGSNLGIGRQKMFTNWRWQTKYTPYCLCKFVNTSPKSEPTLELHSRAAPSVHHCASGPNTGRNSGGKWKTKKNAIRHPHLPPPSVTHLCPLPCVLPSRKSSTPLPRSSSDVIHECFVTWKWVPQWIRIEPQTHVASRSTCSGAAEKQSS